MLSALHVYKNLYKIGRKMDISWSSVDQCTAKHYLWLKTASAFQW